MSEDINIPNNLEIDKALKEFEAQSSQQSIGQSYTTSKREVSGVSFDTDSYKAVRVEKDVSLPKMVQWVMKLSGGAIKEQRQAEYVLLGVAILMLALSFYFFFGGNSNNSSSQNPVSSPSEVVPL